MLDERTPRERVPDEYRAPEAPRAQPGSWAVIGAGPHGLAATKALLQLGIDAWAFERAADVGGNWNFHGSSSRVYESTHLISTKPFTQFPDFPMPDAYPDYPSHWQVHAYMRAYAEHFGLRERIRFRSEVVDVQPRDGGGWQVTWQDVDSGAQGSADFAGVVIANGHNWSPKLPAYPGQASFTGELIHSSDYKSARVLDGRRVLVIGAGNTGCDIAVEAAQHARSVWHSTRRGYYYNPKYALGRPSDQTADLLLALRVPLTVRRAMYKAVLRLTVGDFAKFGLPAPDHAFYETHPIVNQQLVYYVGHGDIKPRPDVDRFEGAHVHFVDGTSAEVDLVICCTGYLARFPFIDQSWLNVVDDHPVLARQVFTPASKTLAVTGLIQPDSGQWTIAHWQGMLIATYAALLQSDHQAASDFHRGVMGRLAERASGGTTYKESTRHYYEIAHQDYLRMLTADLHRLEGLLDRANRPVGPIQPIGAGHR